MEESTAKPSLLSRSDAEIRRVYLERAEAFEKAGFGSQTAARLGPALLPVQTELMIRAVRASDRRSRFAFWIAALSFVTTAVVGVADYRGDSSWRQEQIRELRRLGDRITEALP